MKLNFKKIGAVVATAAFALSLTACSGSKTVVSYKGGKITQDQFYNKLKQSSAGKTTLASMIINNVLEAQYGKKVSNAQVNKLYNKYKTQYGSSFSNILSYNGLTLATFKDNLKTNLLSEAALKDTKKISSAQQVAFWKTYIPKVTVQHILVSSSAKAKTIIKQLRSGASFASLAKKYSTDTSTKNNAGKLPSFDSTDTTLNTAFKTAAFKLKPGKYTTSPVKSTSGYHVIKMISRASKGSIKDNKALINKQLYAKMAQDSATMKTVIASVLKRANVSIKDNDLKDALTSYLTATNSQSSTQTAN
ncbi:MAG: peptidylprolyl isomerase PrsA [Lactobacillus sp.]|nr:peptidylprolyl isomerase [Lactobacillus sp.]MDN6051959.1 peptidylprolyl isomerase [Lactobacillus sp.]